MPGSLDARAKGVFDAVIDLPAAEREAEIARLCAGDDALRERAGVLLMAAEREDRFLDSPTVEPGGSDRSGTTRQGGAREEAAGEWIGDYRLLERIGEGGFSTVFMAEQERPLRRRVALKILKPGMDTRAVVARFDQERQALALMDHPNIAKVFDAGSTPSGRPYFAMELVKGEAITEYCDRERLPVPARLALFTQVCRAVQHAHLKGVIHRDIKPGNVLVATHDGRPTAKVIDFGIAKATERRLTEKTLFTEFRQFVGTPEYMSPEQALGSLDVDARTDVYSLGVLLYELLAGDTPLNRRDLRSAAFAEMQRMIRDIDPPAPSTRLSRQGPETASVAAVRSSDPRALSSLVKGELDWIVMRALEKDRSRRYDTASALASDVERFLEGRPVEAAPASAAYRLRKFVRRNRALATAGSLVAAALVLGLAAALWQADRASKERDLAREAEAVALAAQAEAEQGRRRTQEVAEFQMSQLKGIDVRGMGAGMRDSILEGAERAWERATVPAEERGVRRARLVELLAEVNMVDVALESLDDHVFERALIAARERFADQPEVRGALLVQLGQTMSGLGLLESAGPPLDEGLALCRQVHGHDDPRTITAITSKAFLMRLRGRLDEAEPLYREAADRSRRALGPEDSQTLDAINNLALFLQARGRLAEAEPLYREALEVRRRLLGANDEKTVRAAANLGFFLQAQGRTAEAEPLVREAAASLRRLRGEHDSDAIGLTANHGAILQMLGRRDEAEIILRDVLAHRRAVLGENHPDTLNSMSNLGVLLESAGRLTEAEPLLRDALSRQRESLSREHPLTIATTATLGRVVAALGNTDEAEVLLREAYTTALRTLRETHPRTLRHMSDYASLLADLGGERLVEAESLQRRAVAGLVAAFGDSHRETAAARVHLGTSLARLDRASEAEAELLRAYAVLQALDGVEKQRVRCARALAELYERSEAREPGRGHGGRAAEWREKAGEK